MLKYLTKISIRLENLKCGMELNSDKWQQTPENTTFVQTLIDEIKSTDEEIEELKSTLSKKYLQARYVSREKELLLSMLEKRAIGLHAESPEKLNEYGITKKW